jgi:hypothetical protein
MVSTHSWGGYAISIRMGAISANATLDIRIHSRSNRVVQSSFCPSDIALLWTILATCKDGCLPWT